MTSFNVGTAALAVPRSERRQTAGILAPFNFLGEISLLLPYDDNLP
jgi:hypothetical protein